jgi:hypothetical protein
MARSGGEGLVMRRILGACSSHSCGCIEGLTRGPGAGGGPLPREKLPKQPSRIETAVHLCLCLRVGGIPFSDEVSIHGPWP